MLATRAILIAGLALVLVPGALLAQSRPPVALTGIVTSDKEGAMEGVVVSAKRASGAVTIRFVYGSTYLSVDISDTGISLYYSGATGRNTFSVTRGISAGRNRIVVTSNRLAVAVVSLLGLLRLLRSSPSP
mgnify:CR=1 FL=1